MFWDKPVALESVGSSCNLFETGVAVFKKDYTENQKNE